MQRVQAAPFRIERWGFVRERCTCIEFECCDFDQLHKEYCSGIAGSTASFADADHGNFNGGVITIQANSTNSAFNRIELSGSYSINGSNQVLFNGTVIGSVSSNGVGASPLTVTFNTNSTPILVRGFIQSLTFRTNGATSAYAVTVDVSVLDPLGASTGLKTVGVSVS